MINTYEGYLNHPAGNILTIDDALKMYTALGESIAKCSTEDKMEFYDDFIKRASKYSTYRCEWKYMSREDKLTEDKYRTSSHDAFIDSLNLLSRLAVAEGIDNSWREELGDERKRIGDFACFVAYMTGISSR